jgi:hypothetical protein
MLSGDPEADFANEVNAALRRALDFFLSETQPNPTLLVIPAKNYRLLWRRLWFRVTWRRLMSRPYRFKSRRCRPRSSSR